MPIGGNVTLLCLLIPNVIWVYWKKNDLTIYSLEVQSNTQYTQSTRYESSNHATRFTIKDLKKTDGGIYHCKVATNDTTSDNIKEGGRVLLSVTGIIKYNITSKATSQDYYHKIGLALPYVTR